MSWLANLTNRFRKKEEAKDAAPEVVIPTVEPTPVEDKSLSTVPKGQVTKVEVHKEMSEEQKMAMIDLVAQGYTNSIVVKKMKEIYDVTVNYGNLCHYKESNKWKPIIKALKAKYRENVHDIDLSHKASRLRTMEYVADKAVEKNDLRMVMKATEEARKEFERNGDGDVNNIFINNPVYNELNVLSTDELLRRKAEATKRLTNKEK